MTSDQRKFITLSSSALAAAFGLSLGACALLSPKAEPAACKSTDLAELETEYVAEAVVACKAEGAHSAAECKALPAIKAKYDAKRKAWVDCK